MAMKDMILKDVKVNDEIYVMVGMKELTGRVESIDEDIIRLSIDDTRIISVALESIGMYEVLNTAKTEESQPTDDEETAPVVEEEVTNPLGEAVILPLQMSFWSTSLDRLCLNDNIKTQCFNRNRDGLLFIGLSQIIDEIIVCTNENALGSIYGRTPKIAERLVALGNNYDFPAIPELLKILLITMDEYSQDVLGRDVKWADVYFADAYIAYKRGDHQKACGYLDRYLRLVPIRDKEIMTIMYFAQYARDPRYVKHPVFAKDVKNSFKKEDNIIRYNKAKDYIINHTSRAQSHRSDTSAVNDEDIYLTVPLTHWPRDISKIKARDVRQICKDNDPSGDFYNELTQIINKLSNGNRINELDLKYNRTQEIAAKIVAVHQRHPHLLLRELLMVLLLKVDEYSSRVIRSDPQFAEVYYADAYKAYLDNDVKRACSYLSRYFETTSLTDGNMTAYRYLGRYGPAYGYGQHGVFNLGNVNHLNRDHQAVYETIKNNVARQTTEIPPVIVPYPQDDSDMEGIFNHVNELIDKAAYEKAYRYLQRKTLEYPQNQALINRFSEINDIRLRARKHLRNMPSDSLRHRAGRARFIEENYDKAQQLYLQIIDSRAEGYRRVILEYADMIKKVRGRDAELDVILNYKDVFMGDVDNKTKYFQRLANAYEGLHDYKGLSDPLQELLKIYLKKGDKSGCANTYFRLASNYLALSDYPSAIQMAKDGIPYSTNIQPLVRALIKAYLSLGQKDEAEDAIRMYDLPSEEVDSLLELINSVNETSDFKTISFLIGEDRYIDYYEKTIDGGFESVTASDLSEFEKNLKKIRFDQYDQLSTQLLQAALMAKALNDDVKYNRYLAESLYNRGIDYQIKQNLDAARSCYLAVLARKEALDPSKRSLDNMINYYIMSLTSPFNPNIIGAERELVRLDFSKLDANDVKALLILIQQSPEVVTILDEHPDGVSFDQLRDFLLKNIEQGYEWVDFKSLADYIGSQLSNERKHIREVISTIRSDALFNVDCTEELYTMKSALSVTAYDQFYLNKLIDLYSDIRECRVTTDYEGRMRRIMRIINDFEHLSHKGTTLFIERYFNVICQILEGHLRELVAQLKKDYKPLLTLSVPIHNVIDSEGNAKFSVTITNGDNHATASHIKLKLNDVNGHELYHEPLTASLKGGASHATLITLNGIDNQALTLNAELSYEYDNDIYTDKLSQFSIAAMDDSFEPIRNPYIDGPKLKWENRHMFFGRDEMIDTLAKQLNNDNVEAVAIYGQKRTGKSSIFEFLMERLKEDFTIIQIDAASIMTSEASFYDEVKNNLIDFMADEDADEDELEELEDMDVDEYGHFVRFMKRANQWLEDNGYDRLLIMIDEFTSLYAYIKDERRDIDDVFISCLKTMIDERLFKMAMIGQDSMEAFIQAYPNQFQSINLNRVNYLKETDAIKLIRQPIAREGQSRYLEHTDEIICHWFNGQPYYIQRYCRKLVETMNENHYNYVTMAIAQKQKEQMIRDENRAFFNNLIEKDDDESMDIVSRIARANNQVDGWVRVDNLNFTPEQMNLFNILVHREVIDYKSSTRQCRIIIPFFRDWLLDN